MTLEYIEVEQKCTKHLSKERNSLDDAAKLFVKDTILLSSDTNKELLEHFKKVVAISVGRALADRVPGAEFLKLLLQNHYDHPNSTLDKKPATIFVKKPQYLHEMKNNDMMEILNNLQDDFLELTAELAEDKEAFLSDIALVRDIDCDIVRRNEAQERIDLTVIEAGEYIGHGDQMTFWKFWDAKRLSQTGVTALERKEYLGNFRIALFHTKMSKIFMDYKASMKDEDNIDDILTLGWFKAWLGLKNITNQESKIKKPGSYEPHDQYITELGMQFMVNAFENFLATSNATIEITTEAQAEQLILDFLQQNEIKFYYDPGHSEEKDKFDDLLSYCRDLCSRTVLSVVFDKLEEESDALGLRAFRISMILYFLNRKELVQDSKYAYSLLLDLVLELNASDRTRQRMDNMVCVNVKGKPGEGIHRDKKCEHFVKEVKVALKGTHSSLKEIYHNQKRPYIINCHNSTDINTKNK